MQIKTQRSQNDLTRHTSQSHGIIMTSTPSSTFGKCSSSAAEQSFCTSQYSTPFSADKTVDQGPTICRTETTDRLRAAKREESPAAGRHDWPLAAAEPGLARDRSYATFRHHQQPGGGRRAERRRAGGGGRRAVGGGRRAEGGGQRIVDGGRWRWQRRGWWHHYEA